MHRRSFLAGSAAAGLAAALPRPAPAAPDADLWPRWQAHDPDSDRTVDHGAWAAFLDAHLQPRREGVNRVDYASVDRAGRDRLDGSLDALAATPISRFGRGQQFAFWVNLYNALTVRLVLEHWPVATIRDIDISPGWFSDGPWGAKLIRVEDQPLSLDDIEHRILRPIWRDPRIHYAVNCAAIGCPELKPEPFQADRLDHQLNAAARDYVNHPRGAEITPAGELVVSSIYTWYQADFGGDDAGVIAHLRRYAAPALRARLTGVSRIAEDRYDWRINTPKMPAGTG